MDHLEKDVFIKRLTTGILLVAVVAIFGSFISYRYGYADGSRRQQQTNEPAKTVGSAEEGRPLYGIDMSSYQKDIYEMALNLEGVDFVICRAADGMQVDKTCDKIYQAAKSKGLLLGVYFYARTTLEAREYAHWCAQTIKGYIGEAIVVLDMEENVSVEWTLEFLQAFEALTGVKPLLYTGLNMVRDHDWSTVVANGNPLWVACYGSDNGHEVPLPSSIPYWGNASIHQYTSKLYRSLDGDVCHESIAWWQEMATPNR